MDNVDNVFIIYGLAGLTCVLGIIIGVVLWFVQ